MRNSVNAILENYEINIKETVYSKISEKALNYGFNMGDYFSLTDAKNVIDTFSEYQEYLSMMEKYKQSAEYVTLKQALDAKVQNEHISPEELRKLRHEKKQLKHELGLLEKEYELEAFYKLFGNDSPKAITYLDVFVGTSFENMKEKIKEFTEISNVLIEDGPIFVKDLDKLKQTIHDKKEIAIESGPCLFGVDEVLMMVETKKGEKLEFDFVTEVLKYKFEDSYIEYIKRNGDSIADVYFINKKNKLDFVELEHLKAQFLLAQKLNCKMVVTIPDMSYIKSLNSFTDFLNQDLAQKVVGNFTAIAYKIADLYLHKIAEISDEYGFSNYEILHARNTELLELFYSKREVFLERKFKARKAKPENLEPIKDYVTFTAFPYYLWGITNILAFNNLREVHSISECKYIHEKKLNIFPMFYMRPLSLDNENDCYFAKQEFKIYRG